VQQQLQCVQCVALVGALHSQKQSAHRSTAKVVLLKRMTPMPPANKHLGILSYVCVSLTMFMPIA
jgi:hypothetical protein